MLAMNLNELCPLPVNPRLKFGVPLSEICVDGNLHPGLRDLFLKAYLNATSHVNTSDENYIRKVLSFGEEGQGGLDERLALKHHLENGQFIITIKTPPGSPLWVLRHFLGRLPKPLLFEFKSQFKDNVPFQWSELAFQCRNAVKLAIIQRQPLDKLKLKLAATLMKLKNENYLVLSALMSLIRNLSVGNQMNSPLNKRAVFTLICYFTQALTLRPFRPGFATHKDRRFYPLILFFIYYWPDIKYLVIKLNRTSSLENLIIEKLRPCDSLPIFHRKESINKYQQKSQSLKYNLYFKPIPSDKKLVENTNPADPTTTHTSILKKDIKNTKISKQIKETVSLKQQCANCHSVNNFNIVVQFNITPTQDQNQQNVSISSPKISISSDDNGLLSKTNEFLLKPACATQNQNQQNGGISSPKKSVDGNDGETGKNSKSVCACNVEHAINLNESEPCNQYTNMGFCVCPPNPNETTPKMTNFEPDLKKHVGWCISKNDLNINLSPTVEEFSVRSTSQNGTDDDTSTNTSTVVKKISLTRLLKRLKLFSRKKHTQKVVRDEFVKYNKI